MKASLFLKSLQGPIRPHYFCLDYVHIPEPVAVGTEGWDNLIELVYTNQDLPLWLGVGSIPHIQYG